MKLHFYSCRDTTQYSISALWFSPCPNIIPMSLSPIFSSSFLFYCFVVFFWITKPSSAQESIIAGSKDHMEYRGFNLGWPCTRQSPYMVMLSLWPNPILLDIFQDVFPLRAASSLSLEIILYFIFDFLTYFTFPDTF